MFLPMWFLYAIDAIVAILLWILVFAFIAGGFIVGCKIIYAMTEIFIDLLDRYARVKGVTKLFQYVLRHQLEMKRYMESQGHTDYPEKIS